MDSFQSPVDPRFFDVQDFNPAQHRVGPVGVFEEVRINLVLFMQPQPALAFMYTREGDRSFFGVEEEIPLTVHMRTPGGAWETYTFSAGIQRVVKEACLRGVGRMTGA
jgi:hypothetical protein